MKILVQNLQKKAGLATTLVEQYDPDIMLAQEFGSASESIETVNNTSRLGYGTAIYSRTATLTNIRRVTSPHAEFGGEVASEYFNQPSNGKDTSFAELVVDTHRRWVIL
eukprot:g9438.t1